ncbi:MAG: nucleoside deaminase [Gammaproteobacteria bacterium]|nr:nucleoside deaminase [Gammaproteobacteria bacterium]
MPADIKRRSLLLGLAGTAAALGVRRAGATGASEDVIVQPEAGDDAAFIARALIMQRRALTSGDQGYGAIVVRGGKTVGQSPSHVVVHQDPTAHAEMEAIRDAAWRLGTRDLSGSTLYSSSPASPMCEAAAYRAGIERMVYGKLARDGGSPRLCG